MVRKSFRWEIEPMKGPDGKPAQYFITLVKFSPSSGPKEFMKYLYEADERLTKESKAIREDREIHEDMTFLTIGRYDMVIIWRAPTFEIAAQYLKDLVGAEASVGCSCETLVPFAHGGT